MEPRTQGSEPSMSQRRRFKEARVDGVSHNVRYMEGGFGEPLVMLPGIAGLQITGAHHKLAERYRVIAFDVPKVRDAFAGRASTVTQDVAEHLGLSIAALGIDSFNLLGSSFGANVALQLAIRQPERVRALILASPTAIRPEPRVTGTPPARAVDGSSGQSIEQQLAALEIPVLILFGTDDLVVPPETGRIYREKLPNCHYVLVYGAGHAIEDDRPDAFVSVVSDFVDGPDGFIVNQRSGLINP